MTGSVVALVMLTALAGLAALAVTSRVRLSGRAEHLVAATVAWNVLVLVPIYVLGFAQRLTAPRLGWASACVSVAALGLSTLGRAPGRHARDVGRALRGLLRLPLDALRVATKPVSGIVVVVLGVEGLLVWSVLGAYYAHSFRMWDSLWYHEPIVAFTIQAHGFARVPLPDSLQRINSLPRVGEMTDLWFAAFAGRRLIDLANSLLAPALVASQYLLCARVAGSRAVAVGWACVLFLTPSVVWQLGSTFVDLHMAFALLAALWFATRPDLALGHALLAAAALTIAVGTKYQALVPVGAIAAIALGRVWLTVRARALDKAAVTAVGAAAIAGFAATTYLRNYRLYGNPFWPYLVPSHPRWPGFAENGQDVTKSGVDFNVPRDELVKGLFDPARAAFNYGLGFAWVVLPLFALAAVVLAIHAVRRAPRPRQGAVRRGDGRSLLLVVVTCLPAVAVVWTSPAIDQGRYHVFVVGSMIAGVAWMTGASRLGGLAGEGAIVAAAIATVAGYVAADPPYLFTPRQMLALARLPPAEREVTTSLGSATYRDPGLAREREVGPGDIVAFGDDYGGFPAEFFNHRFSNRAVYLPDADSFVADAERLGARWVFCAAYSPCARELDGPGSGWASLGELHILDDGRVYHRVAP